MIIKDLQPISIVEDRGFKDLFQNIYPEYILPTRKYLTQKLLPDKYETVKKLLKEKINLNCIWAGLTTDGWSSYTGQSYISVTCHFIEESWKRQDVFLSLSPLFKASTAEYLTERIRSTLKEYDLDEKRIVSITHDQGSNTVDSRSRFDRRRVKKVENLSDLSGTCLYFDFF